MFPNDDAKKIDALTDMRIVVLTGAGISAESGIQTFRAADGLWEEHHIEDVATPEGFERNPRLVQQFYNQRREQLLGPDITPNPAHYALAELAHAGAELTLVTQNIDDLHERAGSAEVIHMHGELLKVFCSHSGQRYPRTTPLLSDELCPCCGEPGLLRPDIVWFGEMPYQMERIYQALDECTHFIAVGTSGNVYPAAGFVEAAAQAGALTIEVNLEPSRKGGAFHEGYYGLASEQLPLLVRDLLDGKNL